MSPADAESELKDTDREPAPAARRPSGPTDEEPGDLEPEHAPLSRADVQELYRRSQLALNSGYTVARGDVYAAELGGSDGSPAGLVELCEASLGVNDEASEATEDGDDEGERDGEVTTNRVSRPVTMPFGRETVSQKEQGAEAYSAEALPEEPLPGEPVREGESEGVGYRLKGIVGTLEDVIDTLPPSQRTKQTEEAAVAVADAKEDLAHKAPDALLGDEHDDTSSDDSPEYESWSKKKLLEEATKRGLDVKHHLTKADIIELLREAD